MNERVLPLYKAAKLLPPDEERTPFMFIPTADGWLQASTQQTAVKPAPKPMLRTSAISGRIVASTAANDGSARRSVTVEEAGSIDLKIGWRKQGTTVDPTTCMMKLTDPNGRFGGFVFSAETAPTAAEALPDLRRGPAATHDLPLEFGSDPLGLVLEAKFDWLASAPLSPWSLLDLQLTDYTGENNSSPSPPACRLAAASGKSLHHQPSADAQCGIVAGALDVARSPAAHIHGRLRPEGDAKAGRPVLTLPTAASWPEFGGSKLFADIKSPSFHDETLILPTLPGVEFSPGGKT